MMKKTIFILTALAALACTAISCRKEFAEMQQGATGFTVTATIAGGGTAENGTKVSATDDGSSLALRWEQGDKLIGFDNNNNTYGFEVTSVDGGKATLTRIEDGTPAEKGTATTDPADGTTMYMLYVPGKTVENLNLNNPSDILNYDLSTQAVDALPVSMTAKGTVTDGKLDLTFEVQTAIIGIKNPTMENDATTSIILSSTDALNTKVTFILDNNGDLKATYDSGDAETVTKAVNFTSTTPGTNTFIVVCPVTSADLTFTSDKGEAFTKEDKTVEAGKYYYMTPTFESTGREITVSFSGSKNSSFQSYDTEDSFSLAVGDEIAVSNGTQSEVCTIEAGLKFTTNIKGNLTAVYPKTALNATTHNVIPQTTVSATQDGTIAGALVASATIGSGTEAVFSNCSETVVYKIYLPSGTKQLTVRSLPAVGTTTRNGTQVAINSDSSDDAKFTVTVGDGTTALSSPCYVALKAGVQLSDLSFDAATTVNQGSMKGLPENSIKGYDAVTNVKTAETFNANNTTAINTVYTIGDQNWHEYAKIGNYKYATMNIGATSPGDVGLYFAWGEVSGHPVSGNDFDFTDFVHTDTRYHLSFAPASGFASSKAVNAPYSKNASTIGYNKYTSMGSLELMDDAAYVNWGGPWSMSAYTSSGTTTPINLLINGTSSVVTKAWKNKADSGYDAQGELFTNASDSNAKVFLPVSGYGQNTSISGSSSTSTTTKFTVYYWAKNSGSATQAFALIIKSGTVTGQNSSKNYRYYGMPIRPVSSY